MGMIDKRRRKNTLSIVLIVLCFLCLAGYGGTKKIALDPESQEFYETAQLIMTKEEKDIFNHLPDKESRQEFSADFWLKRDPDPATEENEYKDEFFRRIEYANDRFKEGPPGWKTDRGRIYIFLGDPDKVEEVLFHEEPEVRGSILFWIYYRYNFGVKFVDKEGFGHFTLDPYYGIEGDLFSAIEMAMLGISLEEGGFKKKFVNFRLSFNKKKKEIAISIPVKSLAFTEEDGLLKADFEFEFHIYQKEGKKNDKFNDTRSFAQSEDEVLKLDYIIFIFPYDLKPGRYYIDVIIIGKKEIGKTRKIFGIKV